MAPLQQFSKPETLQIEDYALIGDMRTCALAGKNGSIDFLCWPHFDSPSIFARILDTEKGGGGYWSIRPHHFSVQKQYYQSATNILKTKWIHEDGVLDMTDFFAVNGDPKRSQQFKAPTTIVRRAKCLRGTMSINVDLSIGLNYGKSNGSYVCSPRGKHGNQVVQYIYPRNFPEENQKQCDASFVVILDTNGDTLSSKVRLFDQSDNQNWVATIELREGQEFYMVMSERKMTEDTTSLQVGVMERDTWKFWTRWIRSSTYRGRFTQEVERSMLVLKLLTFDETGAIIAAPTFSLPEAIGGGRNWDYRYSWIRDSSFTVYVFLKLGFPLEAEKYMEFIFKRMQEWKDNASMKHLPLMFSIHGETDLPEEELDHLGGYKDSRPVRIGNAAASHVQLDIYGELMDAIYLYNKHGKPVSYQEWCLVQHLTDFVCDVWQEPDMSIWETRGGKQQFTYSKIMLWVAVDRAIRLSEKRNFPCPQRLRWMEARDKIYMEVMDKSFNKKMGCFIQSYEANETLDAAVLIAPLVFFISPNDPQFISTLDQIVLPPDRGGLTSAGFVFRYNHDTVNDGVGGREGTFVMCTLWFIEACIRAGAYDNKWLGLAITMFENVLNFRNHVGMLSEEIAISGEQLGNTPQAFSHLAFVSAALNLDRVVRTEGIDD